MVDQSSLSHEQEGVIKFVLEHNECPLEQHPHWSKQLFQTLNHWRHIQYRLDFIGQQADRYDGYGFGNISLRLAPDSHEFLISGTQTGAAPFLTPEQYAIVNECDPEQNFIRSIGPTPPSSEAMTHGQLYQLDGRIGCVIHAHSPEIWLASAALNLPSTAADVPYGTPQMAAAVAALFEQNNMLENPVFTMQGHQDGVVAIGRNFAEATAALTQVLVQALAYRQS